ncbi:MAG TPA: DEAD/DEAH box helicase, partial [Saprospiraceae bacterium]|nr:DEAD/DEAH box helicase [Saprospiraceae bacterium]
MRKTYGNTWWGKEWLNALAQIDYSNRLPRGRTYANKGLVGDIKIAGNKITSSVKGSHFKAYKISITIPKFSAKQKFQIIEMVTDNPALLSKLLNRNLPNFLNQSCKRIGIDIFPSSWNDMKGSCSCPDWAVPCKHMAATLYLIANEIDKNPFIVFQLHDFDLFKGLEGVGYSMLGQQETHITKLSELMVPFSFDEEKFVWQKEVYKDLDFSKIPNCKEQLLSILSSQAVFFPLGNFKSVLEKAYRSVARTMLKRIKKNVDTELSSTMDSTDEIELLLDAEFDFLTCNFRNNKGKLILHLDNEEDLMEWLETIPSSRLDALAPELRALFLTFRLAEKLVIQSACIPQLLKLGTKHYRIRWLPALINEEVKIVFEKLQALTPPNILYYKKGKDIYQPCKGNIYLSLLSFFISYFFNSCHNLKGKINETEVGRLFFNGSLEHFATFESREYPMAIQLWLNKFYIVDKQYIPVIQVTDSEAGFQVEVAIENTKKPNDPLVTLPQLFKEHSYTAIRLPILRDLAMLSDYFPQIDLLLATKGKEKLFFDAAGFVHILFKILPSIQLFGIKILLPKALRKLIRPKVSMVLESRESGVVSKSSLISLDNILSFQWQIAIGDQLMNQREFLKLVKQFSGIVKLNEQYVFFDEKEIKNLLDKLEAPPELDSHQILQVALTEEYEGAKVSLDAKTKQLIDGLLKEEKTKIPKKLKATLRPYQQRGYEWLYKNTRVGFGSVIADDMGLGKTLQVIATLLKLKEDGEFQKHKALIIVPTTLLTNWEKEIQKFAPSLDTHVYHGSNRNLKALANAQILITTYGVIRSEGAKLQKLKWLVIVIDEAQNIKNPGTAQTKAVKKIKA